MTDYGNDMRRHRAEQVDPLFEDELPDRVPDIYAADSYPGEQDDPGERTIGEKLSDAAQEVAGRFKERWGEMTDDERMEAEGQIERAEAEARKAEDHSRRPFDGTR